MGHCIALTGSIASGKSLAAAKFRMLGVDVFNADEIAKSITLKGTPSYKIILEHFGSKLTLPNGELNRTALRDIIFNEPSEKRWLEQLLHPQIRKNLEQKVVHSESPYCVVEIPLLTDKTHYPYINQILLLNAPQELQIQRVMQRDDCSMEQAKTILSLQPSFEDRKPYADFIINNYHSPQFLNDQIENLHKFILVKLNESFK